MSSDDEIELDNSVAVNGKKKSMFDFLVRLLFEPIVFFSSL